MTKITVDKAISKGHQMVNYPVYAIMLIGFSLTTYFAILKLNSLFVATFGISTFILMWLWWSFAITRWRIWAFGSVRNVHALKRKAIEGKLIWPDGSIFEKTEIRSKLQVIQLRKIQYKFNEKDTYEHILDEGILAENSELSISYLNKWVVFYFAAAMGVYGFYIMITEDGNFVILLFSIIMLVLAYPKDKRKGVQLTISEKGILSKGNNLFEWKDIEDVYLKLRGSGKGSTWDLRIDFEQKVQGKWNWSTDVSNLNKSPKKIEYILKVYRQRYVENKNNEISI